MMRPGVLDLMQLGSTAFSGIFLYLNSLGVGWAVQSWILKLGVAAQTLDFWTSGFLEFRIFKILGFWIFGFLVSSFFGFLDFWFSGFLVFWFFGFYDFWISG